MEKILEFLAIIQSWVPFIVNTASVADDVNWGLDKVKAQVSENREPSDEEWAELRARREALQASVHTD